MDFEYYKKDIHRSIEQMLYGFFTYQYFLDASFPGLLLRCLVQVQFLANKQMPMRIGFYVILLSSAVSILRHCLKPNRYGAIIDFIGQVHPPSKKTLLFLDFQIMLFQSILVIISTQLPADRRSRSSGSSRNSSRNASQGSQSGNTSSSEEVEEGGNDNGYASSASHSTASPRPTTRNNGYHRTDQTSRADTASTSRSGPSASSASAARPADMLRLSSATPSSHRPPPRFNGPPPPTYVTFVEAPRPSTSVSATTVSSRGGGGRGTVADPGPSSSASVLFESSATNGLDDFYRDDEEEIVRPLNPNNHHRAASDDGEEEEEEEGDASMDLDDFDQVLDQETFVVQVRWDDTWEYLWSDQAGLAGMANAATTGASSSSSSSADPVARLPV